MLKRGSVIAVVGIVLFGITGPLRAEEIATTQVPAATISPEKRVLIERFLRASGTPSLVIDLMRQMENMKQTENLGDADYPGFALELASEDPRFTQEEKATIRRIRLGDRPNFAKRFEELFHERLFSQTAIAEGLIPVLANQFNEQELQTLIAFYESPVGQKFLSFSRDPTWLREAMARSFGNFQQKLLEITKEVLQELPPPQTPAATGSTQTSSSQPPAAVNAVKKSLGQPAQ